ASSRRSPQEIVQGLLLLDLYCQGLLKVAGQNRRRTTTAVLHGRFNWNKFAVGAKAGSQRV
ncbi:hypothetical protein M514_10717, partial [Trichuris suis]